MLSIKLVLLSQGEHAELTISSDGKMSVQPAKELSSIKMQRGVNIRAKEKGATKQAYQDRQSQILRKLPLCRRQDRLIDLVIPQHSKDH